MACVAVGSYEMVIALSKAGLNAVSSPILIGGPLTVGIAYFMADHFSETSGLIAVLAGLSVMVVASVLLRLKGPVKGYLSDIAGSGLVISYLPLLLSMVTLLLAQPNGHMRVALYFLVISCSDTAAFATGILIGRHKMAPHISPGKTWEGFIGSIVITSVVTAFLAPAMVGASHWAGALIGALLAIAGAVGDLVESMMKRDVAIKDMSTILPGHGGAMDRLDSLLVAAPVAWLSMLLLV